jgi:hypothetical protein
VHVRPEATSIIMNYLTYCITAVLEGKEMENGEGEYFKKQ